RPAVACRKCNAQPRWGAAHCRTALLTACERTVPPRPFPRATARPLTGSGSWTGRGTALRRRSTAQGFVVVPPIPLLFGSEHGEGDDRAEHGQEPNQLRLSRFLRRLVEPRPIDAHRDPRLEENDQGEHEHAEQTPAIHDARF